MSMLVSSKSEITTPLDGTGDALEAGANFAERGRKSSREELRGSGRTRLILLLKIALAAGLLIWLVQGGKLDFGRLLTVPLSPELGVLIGMLLGSLALPAVRWWWLLRIQGLRESFGRVVLLTWIGYFTALLLPGAAGGDVAKGYLIVRRRKQARARALSTVLADRLLGVYSLLILGSFAIGWVWARGEMSPLVLAMAGGTLSLLLGLTLGSALLGWGSVRGLLLQALPPSWREAWDESIALYLRNKVGLAGCFLLSVASNAMVVASFILAGGVLDRGVPLGGTFLAGPLVVLANCLPLSPGGIGVAEAAADGLFGAFNVPSGAELMVLVRVCTAALALPGVFGFLRPAFNSASSTASPAPAEGTPL